MIDPRRIELLEPMVAEILRRKTPAERLQMTLESNRFLRQRLEAHLRHQHADWTDSQVQAEVARRVLHGAG